MSDYSASVAAGGFAGVVSTCLTNPFDVLRTRLSASRAATGSKSKSILVHLRLISQSVGLVRGMAAGIGINLITSIPSNAVYLSSYKFFSETLPRIFPSDVPPIVLTAGAATGAVIATNGTLGPLFTVRTRVQIAGGEVNSLYVFRDILKRDGLLGFYRGVLTNVCGRIVEEATFWCLFESAKRALMRGDFGDSFMQDSATVIALSMGAKLTGTAITYPYVVLMTHIREVDRATGHHNHTRVLPTMRFIVRQDGLSGFYKGLSAHLLRCMVSRSSQIYAFECAMLLYHYYKFATGQTK